MIKTYFKTAWRNLSKHKAYSLINILGLTLGIASCLVIFLVVKYELNYDRFHSKANRTYRVTLNAIDFNPSVSLAVAPAMRADFPELEAVCEQIKPYTVVMGSQGTTAAERMLFGGHTVYAMKYLMWPIITVPPKASFSTVKKIGIACDLSKVIDTMPMDEINLLVKDFNAELYILNIDKWQVFNPDTDCESVLLEQMMRPLNPTYHFITNKNTDEGIMDFAEKNNIDLLIVLPRRRGLLRKIIHRSHTKQLILHSHVPVMALHHEIL